MMKIRAWGPLFALLALFAASLTGVALQHSKYNQPEPPKAEDRNSPTAKTIIGSAPDKGDKKGKDEKGWTDPLLVLFNGLLTLFTWLLYRATQGLFKETAGLRTAADKQSLDMQASIKAATDAAAAAIKSNQIAVYNAEQQLRAYVTVQEVNMVTHRQLDRMGNMNNIIPGSAHTYRFAVILKNGGMTPAINAKINISYQRFNHEIPADYDFPDSIDFGNALIGPGLVWFTPAFAVPAPELETPSAAGFHFIYGWIEYDDIFAGTKRHRTEFCFQIICERLQRTNEMWISFEPHSRYNAADGDCLRPYDGHENKYG